MQKTHRTVDSFITHTEGAFRSIFVALGFTVPLIVMGDSVSPVYIFVSIFVYGIALGIIGSSVVRWWRMLIMATLLLASSSDLRAASQAVVDDGLAVARGETSVPLPAPSLQLAASPVAVVVVIGGTVAVVTIGYYIVRACHRLMNSTNMHQRNKALEEASQNYNGGTCLADVDDDDHLIRLHYDSGRLTATLPEPVPMDPPPYGQHYWLAGELGLPEESRISFDSDTVRVAPADSRFLVERSTDLISWEPVLTIEQPGEVFDLEDTFSQAQMFYRVR